ncbi:hypothetical protein NQ315_003189 [Exocentrus adspersus]|uniref:Tyr recombinase domain-containing protein n=1 Tax=Exocentrus adspersus TaxID=1586481 RepID=A0AAV8VMI3_9CUCU|nr:hypothetical protein NQ315_003189 [Exocentrus adspersus]
MAYLTEGTLRQYSACFRKNWEFCLTKGHNPFMYDLQIGQKQLPQVHLNQPLLVFPFFKDKPQLLCVACTITAYMEKTQASRDKELSQNLILTIKKPVHTASAQTISRWIKNTLDKAGIDTTVFSAYSTRHASTSAAFTAGVATDKLGKLQLIFLKYFNKLQLVFPITPTLANTTPVIEL